MSTTALASSCSWRATPDGVRGHWTPPPRPVLPRPETFTLTSHRGPSGWTAEVRRGGRVWRADRLTARDHAQTWCEETAWELWTAEVSP